MSTTTTVRPGSLFSYQMDDTAPILLTEVLGLTADGGVICAETLSTDSRRTSAVVDIEVFTDTDAYTYLGDVRPSADRLPWIEDGDLFVYTYAGPGANGTSGNTFVLEISHAYVPGDPEGVRGFVHLPSVFVDLEVLAPIRFERSHLRDFQYVGKIDNGSRDGTMKAHATSNPEADTAPDPSADETARPTA